MFATDMMSDINSSMSNARYSSSGMTGAFGADDYELDALFDEVKTLFDRHIETHPLFESFSDDDVLKRQAKNMLNKPEIQDAAREIEAQQSNSNINKIAVRIMIAAIASLIAGAVGGGLFGAMLYILTNIALTPDSGHDFYRAEQLGGEYGIDGYDEIISAKASAAMGFGFKVAFVCCVVFVLYNHYQMYKREN